MVSSMNAGGGGLGGGGLGGGGLPPSGVASKGPRARVCWVCGRQYGLSSFDIHLKQCKILWEAREAKKPPHERKPLPPEPSPVGRSNGRESVDGLGDSSRGRRLSDSELDAQNAAATEQYNSVALSACQFCGRTFLAEKLAIHNRSCTAEHPAKSVSDSIRRAKEISPLSNSKLSTPTPTPPVRPKSSPSTPSLEQLVECDTCGRKMPKGRADMHIAKCKAQAGDGRAPSRPDSGGSEEERAAEKRGSFRSRLPPHRDSARKQALQASEAANAGPGHEGEDDAHTNGRASSTAHEGRGNSRPDSPSREGAAGEDGEGEGSRCGSARAGKAKATDHAGVVAQLERRLGLLESQAHSMLEEIADIRDTLEGLKAEQGPGAA